MHSDVLSQRLKKEYDSIFASRKRIEKANVTNNVYIADKDLNLFYDGMFLKSVTLFESFVEEFFIGLLYDKYKLTTRKKIQKQIFKDRKLVLNYLLNGKPFLDLLPLYKLERNTKVFYKNDNPFSNIPPASKDILNHIFIIRNAIAHSSVSSDTKFKRFIEDNHNTLPINQRTPSKFLQSLRTANQTMFETYVIELNFLAQTMTRFS
ncbi:hypothetical protein [Flavobacterium litorale]|uniref:RiboL-PSP-HEPN domain-containing protein n=1 Tax=Flavobacterium litorale TaxID=2856519 RepID=A0ABX8V7G9_9FLAO|nr:hypothetical protein [Flavobacterium litorale]QYJ68794.1 hypothetical protein K1I41_02630 [Flavobacterium litorale]